MRFNFKLLVTGLLLIAGGGLGLVDAAISPTEFNTIWSNGWTQVCYSGGQVVQCECNDSNHALGCVRNPMKSAGAFTNEGDVQVRKLVWPTSIQGVYDVAIGVRGKDLVKDEKTCSVVVFDVSQSMRECYPEYLNSNGSCQKYPAGHALSGKFAYIQDDEGLQGKWHSAVSGAILFSQIATSNPNNKVGLVLFGTEARKVRDLGTGEFVQDDFYDPVTGSTNLHHGLIVAGEMLTGTDNTECEVKNIIVMSDGVPTCYMGSSGRMCVSSSTPSVTSSQCARYATGFADELKGENIKIYTIGYEMYGEGQGVLREVASQGNHYQGNQSNIGTIFNQIGESESVLKAGEFVEVEDNLGVEMSVSGSVVTANSGESVSEDDLIVKSFQIAINSDASGFNKSNNGLTFTYKDAGGSNQTLAISSNDSSEIYWEVPTVTVTFNPNGGTPTPDPVPVTPGGLIPPDDYPVDPELTGYHLTGWTITCDGNDFFNFATDVVTEDITLCAKWEPNTYQVKFDKNGGNGTMGNQTFTYNVSGNLNQNSYTKQGAIFNGWNTKQGGNGTSYKDKQEVRNLATTGTVTLYAQWLDNEVTVTFDPNGGTPTPDPKTVDSGDIVPEPEDPVLTGHHLTGWTRTCNGNDFFNFATDVVTGDITLCAKWEPNTYQVKFDKNGGNGTMGNQTFIYNVSGNLNQNSYTKQGAIFNGWNTKQGGNGTSYKDRQEVRNLATTGTVTLYAQWLDNEVTVTFDPNGGTPTPNPQTVDSGDTVDEPEDPVLTGHHLTGWTKTCNGNDFFNFATDVVTGDITLCAKWEPNTYTIVYSGNGSTSGNMPNQSLTYDTTGTLNPNNFGKKGYTFKGWNTKPDGTGTPYQDKAQVRNLATTGTVELYAQWEPSKYTIKFDGNGATAGSMSGLEVEYDKDVTLTKNAYRKGSNKFLGWNTRADGNGTSYSDEQVVRNLATEGEIVLYAQWKSGGGSSGGGGGGSKTYVCLNLPSNAVENNSLKPSGKNVDYYYSTDKSVPCTFLCKNGYVWDENAKKCVVVPPDDDPTPILPPDPECSIEGSTHSAEVNEAYVWACKEGIIKSKTITGAKLGEFLNRAEMAKITTIFEMLEVGTMPDRTKDCSAFEASMSGYNSEMKNYMVTSCQLLRMGIHTADYTPIPDFMPRKFVSRAEFGTILSRILWGDKYEAEKNSRYYYVDHLYKLRDEGILTNIDPTLVERRSYAILMIYRAAKMLGKI